MCHRFRSVYISHIYRCVCKMPNLLFKIRNFKLPSKRIKCFSSYFFGSWIAKKKRMLEVSIEKALYQFFFSLVYKIKYIVIFITYDMQIFVNASTNHSSNFTWKRNTYHIWEGDSSSLHSAPTVLFLLR